MCLFGGFMEDQQKEMQLSGGPEPGGESHLSKVTSSQHWNAFEVVHLEVPVRTAAQNKKHKDKRRVAE